MDLRTGAPYFIVKNGLPFEYPKLNSDIATDVVVLGGGISGALVSYYLSKAGIENVVIDTRTIGFGSTAASTSFLQYEIDTSLSDLSEMIGADKALRAYKLTGDAINKLADISREIGHEQFNPCRSIYFTTKSGDLKKLTKEYHARKEAGFDVSLLGANELKVVAGFKGKAAIHSELAGETDAYMMAHHLHQFNISLGSKVFDRTEAVRIVEGKNGIEIVVKNGNKISTKKVVYATGYEVTEMIYRRIVKLRTTYATISEQMPEPNGLWKEKLLFWNMEDPYLYFRKTSDHRVIVGGRDDFFNDPRKRARRIPSKTKQLVKDFKRLYPGEDFIPEYNWAGTFGYTKDGLPFIGTVRNRPHSYFSLGFGGNGITFGQIGAELICDLVMGKRNNDLELFAFDR